MCNDYRLEVDIASIAEDFEDLEINLAMPEGCLLYTSRCV